MELSTRNQLQGTVRSVKTGTIMAEVVVDDGQEVVAAITRAASSSSASQRAMRSRC